MVTSTPISLRASRAMLALAILVEALVGLYGIDQPVVWGHQGFHVAEHGLAARNLRRHGTMAPTRHHGPEAPADEELTFHHPFLLHPYIAGMHAVFGESPWTARAVPLGFALLALAGLWSLAVRIRGPATAAVAAWLFVLTPLQLAFANLPDHQLLAVAYVLWSMVGLHDLLETGRRRHAVLWLGGAILAGLTDWPWYPTAFLLLVGLAVLHLRGRLRDSPVTAGGQRGLLAVFAVLVLATFAQHFAHAAATDRLDDLVGAFGGRGASPSFAAFLDVVKLRVRLFHTPLLAGLTGAWLVLLAWRHLVRRRPVGVGALAMLALAGGATIHLLRFQVEFMVHDYRSLWFVPVMAFAGADVLVSAGRLVTARVDRPRLRALLAAVPAMAVLVGFAVHAPAWARVSRRMAGSVTHPAYDARVPRMMAARAAHALTEPDDLVLVGGGLRPRVETFWLLDRRAEIVWSPEVVEQAVRAGEDVVLMDQVSALRRNRAWKPLLGRGRTLIVGDVAIVDLRPAEETGTVEAARVVETPTYGAVAAWLHAPRRGPQRLAPAPVDQAVTFAERARLGEDVLERARAGGWPLLESLPESLREPGSSRGEPSGAAAGP